MSRVSISKTLRLLRFLNPEKVEGSFAPSENFPTLFLSVDLYDGGIRAGGGPPTTGRAWPGCGGGGGSRERGASGGMLPQGFVALGCGWMSEETGSGGGCI
jgi:hypothetical protein